MAEKENLFDKSVFQYANKNTPIPVPDGADRNALSKMFDTNSTCFTTMDYKAKKSSQIKPEIVKEVNKTDAKEYRKWNGKCITPYERKQMKELKTKAFDEILFDDIDERSELFLLKKLLTKPNNTQTWSDFLYLYSLFIDNGWAAVWGEKLKYGVNANKYQNLYQLPTHLIDILGGTHSDPITGYRFKNNYQTTYAESDVIRISSGSLKYDTNGGHLYGVSKIKVAYEEFSVISKALEREFNSFDGGDVRAMFMPKTDIGLPSEALEENTTWFQKFRDGILKGLKQRSPQRFAIIGHPVDVVQFSDQLKTQLTTEAITRSEAKVSSIWGLHPNVVFAGNKDSTFANQKEYIADSLRSGVFPDLRKLEEAMRENIVKAGWKGYSLNFDYDVYEELNTDIKKEIESLSKADFISDNEKREWIDMEYLEDEKANIPRAYWAELFPPITPEPASGEDI